MQGAVTAARFVSKALDFIFAGDKEKKKNFIMIWLTMGCLLTFGLPVIFIGAGIQMIEERITDFFSSAAEMFEALFGEGSSVDEEDLYRWMNEDMSLLEDFSEADYPSLSLAYGISYYFQVLYRASTIDEDFMEIFRDPDQETCLAVTEERYGITFPEGQLDALMTIGSQLRYSCSMDYYNLPEGGQLLPVEENTYYPGSDPRAEALWNEVYTTGGGNPYYYIALRGGWNPRQCTAYAWYRFYQYYGYSCGVTTDGKSFAAAVVSLNRDRFELCNSPAAGAVVSFPATATNNAGHVAFVERVEGEYMWYSEGNYNGGGIRMNTKVSIADLTRAKCGSTACLAYAVPKG